MPSCESSEVNIFGHADLYAAETIQEEMNNEYPYFYLKTFTAAIRADDGYLHLACLRQLALSAPILTPFASPAIAPATAPRITPLVTQQLHL
jgi:hypothetical protein